MVIKRKVIYLLSVIGLLWVIYALSNVDTSLTQQDGDIVSGLKLDDACSQLAGFEDELQCISAIQDSIYSHISIGEGIGHNQSREPLDLLRAGKGLCYDRSRFMEKVLSYYDFNFRHVSIFYDNVPSVFTFLDKKAKSHAFTEVLTSQGWVLVDSIDSFIAVDEKYKTFTAKTLRSMKDRKPFIDFMGNNLPSNFYNDYSVVYGLYSRHGKFYPPYTPIPDINWKQFLLYNW